MGTSFLSIFGAIPPMLCKSATNNYDILASDPIEKLGLAPGYVESAKGDITGVYEGCGSELETKCPGLKNGCKVEAKRYTDGFDARITLNEALTPWPRFTDLTRLELTGAFLYIRCITSSSVDLVWMAKPKGQAVSFKYAIHIPQLMTAYYEHQCTCRSTSAETALTTANGTDMAALVGEALGFVPDFATLLPTTVPYAPSMRVRSIMYMPAFDSKNGESMVRVELELGESLELESQADGAVAIQDLTLLAGAARRGEASSVFLEAHGRLIIAGVPVDLFAAYPSWQVSADVLPSPPLPLADIAAACGLAIPSVFQKVALVSGHARFDLSSGGSRGAVRLDRLDCTLELAFSASQQRLALTHANDDGSVAMTFEYGSVTVGRRGGFTDVRVRGDVVLRAVDGSPLFSFAMQGALAQGTTGSTFVLEGFLRQADDAAFAQVYAALTGRALPAKCPTIELRELSASLAYADLLSVQAFAGTVRVKTTDRGVFGCDLSFLARMQYSAASLSTPDAGAGTTKLAGEFQLAGRFSLAATVTIAQNITWAFQLVLGTARIALTYAGGTLSAVMDAGFSLGDATEALLRLFDPTASFDRTGAWSFLNEISLKGASLTYSFAEKRLRIALTPHCSVPFLQMTGLAVVVDAARGVTLEVTGTFDGETYPAEKPLTFTPNDPPRPSGNALRVEYLAVADGITVSGLRGGDVQTTLAHIQEALHEGTDPKALAVDPAAGALVGADFTITQCVQVKLVYSGGALVVGGHVRLFGPKAGPLDGLEAELGYAKINNQLGMFSADFVPPEKLRRIVLGSLTLGIGHMSARLFTNGDFTIDLGFPSNGDFTYSFMLSYGVFDGAGGAYLKRLSTPEGSTVPATTRGRFSPVLQLGVGMRLSLAKGFDAGLLSASAYFSLQGLFEGVYATFLPNGSTGSASYYRLDAAVVLDGRIQGSVNFGLIGAAVSVQARTSTAIRLEAYRAASVAVDVYVAARAQIRILFVRLTFSFDLAARVEFPLGSGGVAPWDGAASRLRDDQWDRPPGLPATAFSWGLREKAPLSLTFPLVDATPRMVVCRVAPVYTICAGEPAAVLLACVSADDFAAIVEALASFAQANEWLGASGPLELFNTVQLFSQPDDLYRFLSERFVFEYAFADDAGPRGVTVPNGLDSSDVLMPLPGFFTQSLETRYSTGVEDVQEEDLSICFMVDEAFVQRMRDYYAKTSEDNANLVRQKAIDELSRKNGAQPKEGDENTAWSLSLAAKMFVDYFQLIVTCVRAQEESAVLRGEQFAATNLSKDQASNVAGAVQRFFLGGHRVLDEDAARSDSEDYLLGNFEAAGELVYLEVEDAQVEEFCFRLEPSETCPTWIRLREGASERTISIDQVRASLPALHFADDSRFVEAPFVRPFFAEVPAPAFKLPATFAEGKTRWFDVGEQMAPNKRYSFTLEGAAKARYAGICSLSLLNCMCDPPLFALVGAARTKNLGLWRAAAAQGKTESVRLFATMGASASPQSGDAPDEKRSSRALRCEATDSACYVLKGMDGSTGEVVQASLDNPEEWLALLELGCASEEPYFLGYPTREACPFANKEHVEVHVVVRHTPEEVFPEGFDVIEVSPYGGDWLEVVPDDTVVQAVVPQGRAAITACTNGDALPEGERTLLDLYASMAVRRDGSTFRETPPFTARENTTQGDALAGKLSVSQGDQRFTVLAPYALEDADSYAAVRAKNPLALQVMWVDLFGNRMDDPDHRVSFTPRYIDNLIPFGAYPGMQAVFRLVESQGAPALSVELRYNPVKSDRAVGGPAAEQSSSILADALLQLEQPDVQLFLSTPLAATCELDKNAWLTFLRSVLAHSGAAASHEQVFPIKSVSAFARLEACIEVRRDASLVETGAPDTAQKAITQLTSLDDKPLPASVAIYEGAGTCMVLSEANPPLVAQAGSLFAFKPLPLATGYFCAPQDSAHTHADAAVDFVQMNAVDLQQILESFLADLATLSQPSMLARMATTASLQKVIPLVHSLHLKTGPALARFLVPLSSTSPTSEVEQAARQAFAAAVVLNPGLNLAGLLAAGIQVEHRIPAALGISVHGTVGEGAGLPTRVGPEGVLGFVVSCDQGRADCSQLSFKVRRLRRTAQGAVEWFNPVRGATGFDEVPLNLSETVHLPGLHRPAPPAVLMALPAPRQLSVAVSLVPYACDNVEFWLEDGKDVHASVAEGAAPVPSPLYWMERYRREASALVSSGTDKDVAALAALMLQYVKALADCGDEGAAAPSPVEETPQVVFAFETDGKGQLTGMRVQGDAQRVAALAYRTENCGDVSAVHEGDRFLFKGPVSPRVGETLVLTATFAAPAVKPSGGWVRLAYRPSILDGAARCGAFDQESARISF